MKLSRYEQEVIINFNVGEEKVTVYSANPAWCRKMDALAKEFPMVFRLTEQTKASRTYECSKAHNPDCQAARIVLCAERKSLAYAGEQGKACGYFTLKVVSR